MKFNRFLPDLFRRANHRSTSAPVSRRRMTTESLECRDMLTDLFNVRLEVSDFAGNELTSVEVGDSFVLSAYGQDLRSVAIGNLAGIFSAYADVQFDASLASVAMRETQMISITGGGLPEGTFTLSFAGNTTDPIGVNATSDTIQTALLALPSFETGDIEVTGGEYGPWTVRFGGKFASLNVPELTVDDSSVLGGSSVEVAQATGINPSDPLDAIGSTTYGPGFGKRERASLATAGLLDEVGAVQESITSTSPTGLFEKLLYSYQFVATDTGELNFQSAFSTLSGNEIGLYGHPTTLGVDEVAFGSTSLMIVGPQAAGQLDATITINPTATDALGQVASLPVDEAWIHEWQDHWVEIWAQLPSDSANNLSAVETAIEYNSDFFTATQVLAGPAFSSGMASDINDTLGTVSIDAALTANQDVGLGEPVLVARVLFESLAGDAGVEVDITAAEPVTAVGEVWTALVDDDSARIELDNASSVIPVVESPPSTDLYPVLYDLDDNGSIGFGDLSLMSGVFLEDVNAQSSPVSHKADYDLSGRVDFGDFTLFSANFLRTRAAGDMIIMPGGFPSGFAPGAASASSAPSASAMLMAEPNTGPDSRTGPAARTGVLETAFDARQFQTFGQHNDLSARSSELVDVAPSILVEQFPILVDSLHSTNQNDSGRPFTQLGDGASQADALYENADATPETEVSDFDSFYADLGS